MRYVVMINVDPEALERLSKQEWQAFDEAHKKLQEATRARGELIDTQELADPTHTTVVRSRGGQPTVTDGPYAETKEFLGGYYVFDVESRERAVVLAQQLPEARIDGCAIEVRPVMSAVESAL